MVNSKTAGEVFSIRLSPTLVRELERIKSQRVSRSESINTFAVEGLRMAAHPGIHFRDGAAGRRPVVIGGQQVWVVASVLREIEPRGEAAIDATAEYFGVDRREIEIAAGYYAAYKDEIDQWIRDNDELSALLHAEHLVKEEILS